MDLPLCVSVDIRIGPDVELACVCQRALGTRDFAVIHILLWYSTAHFNLKLFRFQYCAVTLTHFNYICVLALTEVILKMAT
jgi:hypothetical protein